MDRLNFSATQLGQPWPLGAHFDGKGINFAVFSAHAQAMDLCLFDSRGTQELANVVIKSPAGPAITASGQCKLVLKNPTLVGPVAVLASGQAEVRIEGGTVTGAISASGSSNVTMKGAKSTGPFNKTGQAVINVM